MTVIACLATAMAQSSDYIRSSRTVTGNGFIYRFDETVSSIIYAYNNNNTLTYEDMVTRDGSEFPDTDQGYRYYNAPASTRLRLRELIDENFTQSEFDLVREAFGIDLNVTVYFDTDTGYVSEVSFRFPLRSPQYNMISAETFHRIETAIKNNIHVEITDAGRRLNYAMMGWRHRVGRYSHPLQITSRTVPIFDEGRQWRGIISY